MINKIRKAYTYWKRKRSLRKMSEQGQARLEKESKAGCSDYDDFVYEYGTYIIGLVNKAIQARCNQGKYTAEWCSLDKEEINVKNAHAFLEEHYGDIYMGYGKSTYKTTYTFDWDEPAPAAY